MRNLKVLAATVVAATIATLLPATAAHAADPWIVTNGPVKEGNYVVWEAIVATRDNPTFLDDITIMLMSGSNIVTAANVPGRGSANPQVVTVKHRCNGTRQTGYWGRVQSPYYFNNVRVPNRGQRNIACGL